MKYLPNNAIVIELNKQRLKTYISNVDSAWLIASGILNPVTFTSIVEYLVLNNFTGIILLDLAEVQKVVYAKNGEIVFARSSINDERLGETLCRMGKLTEEALIKASKEITPSRRLGRVLVENGYITPRDLWLGVKRQIFEIWGSYLLPVADNVDKWFHIIQCQIDEANVIKPNSNMLESLFEFLREKVELLNIVIGSNDMVHLNNFPCMVSFNAFEKAIIDKLLKNNDMSIASLAKEINADESSTEAVLKPLVYTGVLGIIRKPIEEEYKTQDKKIEELLELMNTIMTNIAEIMSTKAPHVNFKANVRDYVRLSNSIFKDCIVNDRGGFDLGAMMETYKNSKVLSPYSEAVTFIKELIQFELFEMKNYLPKDQTIELENIINALGYNG